MMVRTLASFRAFHELPLVLFTFLVAAGCGLASAHLLLSATVGIAWLPPAPILFLSAALTGTGILASVAHLGRPLRGPRVLVRLGRSRLSNEVALCVLALVGLSLSLSLPQGHLWKAPSAYTGMGLSVATLLALGRVYALPGQMTWGGAAVFQPLTLGTAWGLSLLYDFLPLVLQPTAERALCLLLVVDALVLGLRWRVLSGAVGAGEAIHPRILARKGLWSVIRFALGLLIPVAGVLAYRPAWVLASLSGALILDRVLFYGLAVKNSTEAGFSQLELAMRTAD